MVVCNEFIHPLALARLLALLVLEIIGVNSKYNKTFHIANNTRNEKKRQSSICSPSVSEENKDLLLPFLLSWGNQSVHTFLGDLWLQARLT